MKNTPFVFIGKYREKTGLYAMLNAYGDLLASFKWTFYRMKIPGIYRAKITKEIKPHDLQGNHSHHGN